MTHRTIITGLALLLLGSAPLYSGCAISDNWDKPIGQHGFSEPLGASYRQQLQAQKFDPVPPTTTPVVGMDGKLAQGAIGTYQNPTPEDQGPSYNEVIRFLMEDN